MTLEVEAERGRLAQEVLDNAVYAESYALIEAELIRAWRGATDARDREQLHQLLGMLNKARTVLESTMRSGRVAASELQRKKTAVDRLMAGWRSSVA